MQIVTNATNATAKQITHGGREYLTVPVVALTAGIVNDGLISADELEKYVEAWNGRPTPLGHPKVNGEYVSANSPELWSQMPGQFWNARVEDQKLKGEIWLDLEKVNQIGGDALIAVNQFRNSQPVEVSTAYFCDTVEQNGDVDGKLYTHVQQGLRPDHLAILLHEKGACSWQDGCGAPRVNSVQEHESTSQSFISALVRSVIDTFVGGRAMNRDEVISALVANAQCKCSKEQLKAMDDETLTAFSDSLQPVVNEEAATLQGEVELTVDPAVEVEVELPPEIVQFADALKQLGSVEKLASALGTVVANADKEHGDLVAELVANEQCTLEPDELQDMPVATLRKLASTFAPRNYGGNAGSVFANSKEVYVMEMPNAFAEVNDGQ